MRISAQLTLVLALAAAGCGMDADGGRPETQVEDSDGQGTITIGDRTWKFVPSIQCSVYSTDLVSISGHAAEDPSLEIVIDYGQPTGVTVGTDGRDTWWKAIRETIVVKIDGARVRGTATFHVHTIATQDTAQGSFDITC